MVFQHSGAQDFDLGGGFHYSGSYPWQWLLRQRASPPAEPLSLDRAFRELTYDRQSLGAKPPSRVALSLSHRWLRDPGTLALWFHRVTIKQVR